MRAFFAFVIATIAVVSACPDESLCQNEDCGSCGNACCKLLITVEEDSTTVMNKLNASLIAGGPDGRYTAQMTAEGTLGFADLRPYNKSVDYIGQAIHTTYAPNYYNDTVDFTVASNDDGGAVILGFSTSLIAGAFCDDSQNFYNIRAVIDGLELNVLEGGDEGIDGSCPSS